MNYRHYNGDVAVLAHLFHTDKVETVGKRLQLLPFGNVQLRKLHKGTSRILVPHGGMGQILVGKHALFFRCLLRQIAFRLGQTATQLSKTCQLFFHLLHVFAKAQKELIVHLRAWTCKGIFGEFRLLLALVRKIVQFRLMRQKGNGFFHSVYLFRQFFHPVGGVDRAAFGNFRTAFQLHRICTHQSVVYFVLVRLHSQQGHAFHRYYCHYKDSKMIFTASSTFLR